MAGSAADSRGFPVRLEIPGARMTVMRRNPVPGSLFPIGGAAALALLLAAGPAAAQGTETGTVAVGERAPDFELEDAHGASYRLSELVERGPVVLEFFRSGGW